MIKPIKNICTYCYKVKELCDGHYICDGVEHKFLCDACENGFIEQHNEYVRSQESYYQYEIGRELEL